jgi:hypothetical protein
MLLCNQSAANGEKPILTDLEFELIGSIVMESLRHTLVITIVFWRQGKLISHKGIVAHVDMTMKHLRLDLLSGEVVIPIDCIASVERV